MDQWRMSEWVKGFLKTRIQTTTLGFLEMKGRQRGRQKERADLTTCCNRKESKKGMSWRGECYDFMFLEGICAAVCLFFSSLSPHLNQSTIYSALNVMLVRKISHLFLNERWRRPAPPQVWFTWLCLTGCGARKESCPTNGTNLLTPSGKLHRRQRWEAKGECYGWRVCKFTTTCVSNAQQTSSTLPFTGPSIICELIVNLCIHGCCFSFFFLVLHSAGNVWIFCFIYWAFTHKSERLGRRPHIFGVSKWDFPAFAISNDLHSTGTEVCVCVYTRALSCIYHFNYLQMLMVVWKLGVMVQSQMTRLQLVTERCVWFVTCCTLWPPPHLSLQF